MMKIFKKFYNKTFYKKDLVILKKKTIKPNLENELFFGHVNTDYMLEIDYTKKYGWQKPVIKPFQNLNLSPFNSTLHYALSCFEGMKAYKNKYNDIFMFRPHLNIERFIKSNWRCNFPLFDEKEFLDILIEYINLEKNWIPNTYGSSLYIRPFTISNENSLGVKSSTSSKLLVVASPVKGYFDDPNALLKLKVDESYERGSPKSIASYKMSANYAPTIKITDELENQGYQQAIWTNNGNMLESGASNIFFVIKKNNKRILVTHPADNCILHGIVRKSILEVARNEYKDEITVEERNFNIEEFIELFNKNELEEIFLSGTAVVINKVDLVNIRDKDYLFQNKNDQSLISTKIRKFLLDIQFGNIKHEYGLKINNEI